MERPPLARQLWHAMEPIHAVAYFHPLPTDALKQLGLKGFWMAYFAGRFAPLGAVTPDAAAAIAFGFAPRMVARSLPDAWRYADRDIVLRERIRSSAAALQAALPVGSEEAVGRLADMLGPAFGDCDYGGRPLGAAWASAVDSAAGPWERLWALSSVLREHRGDGHVVAATATGLGGLETTLTHVAAGGVTRELIQPSRGWTDDEWNAATRRLHSLGILDPEGNLTELGRRTRKYIEDTTDRLAHHPIDVAGADNVRAAIEEAVPLSRHLMDHGVVPVPNPIGVPRP